MGPKRDVIGELAEAVRRQSLVFGALLPPRRALVVLQRRHQVPFRRARPASSPTLYGPAQPKTIQPERAQFLDRLAPPHRARSSTTTEPQLLWFDWWIEQPGFEPYLRKFAAYYYNRARRSGAAAWPSSTSTTPSRPGTAVFDIERGRSGRHPPALWQNDTSVSELLGLDRQARTTRRAGDRSPSWSTSSPRTARCC